MRRFAPADTNIVTGLEVPNGYDPLFSRGDNAAGGTRLVPVLPEPCGATEILFACQFSSLRGKLQPFPHGEGDWESRIRISTREDAVVTFRAYDGDGNMLGETLREIEGSPGGTITLELTPEQLFSVEEIPDIERITWVRATSAGIRLFGEKGVAHIANGADRSQAYSLAASTLDLGRELVAPSVKSGNGYWSELVVTNPFEEQQTFEVYGWKVIEDFINGRTRQQVRFARLIVAANGQVRRSIAGIFGPWAGEVEYVTLTVDERSANMPGRLAGMVLTGHEQIGTMDAYEMTPCGEPRFVIYKRSDSFEHNDPAPIVEHTVILRGRFHQGHGSDYKIAAREGLRPAYKWYTE